MTRKKTHEEFVEEILNLVEKEYTILDTYINAKTKIKFKHNNIQCGFHEFLMTPHNFLQGKRCPKCNRNFKKTTEQFMQEIVELVGDEYTLLDEYTNAKTKIRMRHNKCSNVWNTSPNDFLSGRRCPACFGNIKKTTEQFTHEINRLYPNEYEILGEYITARQHITIKHIKCNCIYDVIPDTFLAKKSKCPRCTKLSKLITTDIYKLKIYDLVGDEYEVLGEYRGSNKGIKIKHNSCGHEWNSIPSDFFNNGSRCPSCNGGVKKTHEEFVDRVFRLEGNNYSVLGEYQNAQTYVQMIHNTCGHIYKVRPYNFLYGYRCPKCNASKGETRIIKYLNENKLIFSFQYSFDDCSYEKVLPFDFAIFDKQNNLICLIEYDGIQHFEPVEHFGGQQNFELTQIRDSIKNNYCKENNINLLRIPYWEFNNIEVILNEYFLKLI